MAQNVVEILVKSRDEAAPDLDALKARLDELSAEVATARAEVDDTDAAAKLDDLQAKLLDLGKRTASPRITMSGAVKAEGQLHAVEASLDRLSQKSADVTVKADGAAEVEAEIAAIGAEMDRIAEKRVDPHIALEGAARVEEQIATIDAELDRLNRKVDARSSSGGLIGQLLTGGGGKGGGPLGALFSGGPGLAGGLSLAPVVGGLLVELDGLVSGFAAAGVGAGAFYLLAHPAISNLTTDTTNLLAAQQKLQAAQNLEAVDPTKAHAKAVTAAQDSLKAVQMSMGQDAGGAAEGIAKLRTEYDKLTKAFAPDVFKVFNAGLKVANNLLPDIMPFAKTFADVLDRLLTQAGKFTQSKGFQDFLKQFHGIEGPALNSIGDGIGKVVIAVGKLFTVMSGKDVAHSINIAFDTIAGAIQLLATWIHGIMQNWDDMSRTAARDAHEVAVSFDAWRHLFASIAHDVASNFDSLRHAVADWAHDMAAHFDEVRANLHRWVDDAKHDVDSVADFFKALPGKILSALGNLGHLLWNAGVQVVQGFINGIASMFGQVAGAALHMVESLGSKVLHALGIGSPSKVAHWWGQMVAQGMADGIAEHAGLPAGAAARMAAGVSSGLGAGGRGGGGYGAAGAGGPLTIQIAPGGGSSGLEQQFWTWLKNGVRAQGGDPKMFNRKVAFI